MMTAAFSGFYLALFLLLWSLVLRGVSIEVSGHIEDPLWREGWHFCFVLSNVLLAVLIGAALGNVVRGVPLDSQGTFALPLFTNFRPQRSVGIFDWYTLSVAVFLLLTFAAHGATGLAQKTIGPVHERSIGTATFLWKIVFGLLAIVTVETWQVRPGFFSAMLHQPLGWLGLLGVGAGGISVLASLNTRRESRALIGSASFIAGLMIAGAAGIFPLILRSTVAPEYSLSAYRTAAEAHSLAIAIVWWPIALVFALGYFWFIYRNYSGKVRPTQDTQIPY
jgi:cytochrome d ubiquinol oxidase subunit II